MAPDKFLPVLNAFGPLPDQGQLDLAKQLVAAVGVYRLEISMTEPRPAEESARLTRIAQSAGRLLKQLGVDDPHALTTDPAKAQLHSWGAGWLTAELYKVAMEGPATAVPPAAERWTSLLLLLSDLKVAADRCASMASQWSPRGSGIRRRGGRSRAGPDKKGRLLAGLFETYAALRRQFPSSGPKLACDEKLKKFVRAGLALAASSAPPFRGVSGKNYELADKATGSDLSKASVTTDDAIRRAFDRWRQANQT
jgi:hypothetical protein